MNTCFECWTWVFDMHAVFRWGIRAWGLRAIEAAIEIEGNVKIDELPCVDVPHNKMQYCHFLQNIVPPEDSTMSKIQSVCHSDSPLDVVTSRNRLQVFNILSVHFVNRLHPKQLDMFVELSTLHFIHNPVEMFNDSRKNFENYTEVSRRTES